eukprot:3175916-Amphidinium_carterae.1
MERALPCSRNVALEHDDSSCTLDCKAIDAGISPAVQWPCGNVVIVCAGKRYVTPKVYKAESHQERDLIEAKEEADFVAGHVRHPVEHLAQTHCDCACSTTPGPNQTHKYSYGLSSQNPSHIAAQHETRKRIVWVASSVPGSSVTLSSDAAHPIGRDEWQA